MVSEWKVRTVKGGVDVGFSCACFMERHPDERLKRWLYPLECV